MRYTDPTGQSVEDIVRAIKDNAGAAMGGGIGALVGGIGLAALTRSGTYGGAIGAYVGVFAGGGVGYAMQHGTSVWQGMGQGLREGARFAPVAIGAYVLGGGNPRSVARNMYYGAILYSGASALANGEGVNGAVTSSVTTAFYGALALGMVKGVSKLSGSRSQGRAVAGALNTNKGAVVKGVKSFNNSPETNPLTGTKYTEKVIRQMQPDLQTGIKDYHGFPDIVDNYAGLGKQTEIIGRDSTVRTKIELYGSYRGREGNFEWIVEPNKTVNHRLFQPTDE